MTIARSLRSRRGLIRLGAVAVAAVLIALVVPGTASTQFGNIAVDTTADGNDGECASDCTLREAIAVADSQQGQFVSVPPGVYRLTLGPITLGNDTVFGVSFTGAFSSGARSTVIDARGASRVFDVPAGASAALAGLTVTGGSAATGGGAFVASEGQLTLIDVIMRDNVASDRGGAIHAQGGLGVTNSTFSGNRAANGGAIASDANTQATIFLSTFSGNSATAAGGAITATNAAALQRVTVAGNTAPAGGGLYLETASSSSVLTNVLFARNSSACGGFTSQRGSWTGSLSDDTSCAFAPGQGTEVADARVGALTNNGGPTDTHALLSGSPAIDAANQSSCPAASADQRHATGQDACDIGAYELGAELPEVQLPPPVAGETVNVSESRGRVRVRLPGSDEFFELEQAQQVPIGSTFDTARGRVNLVAAGQQRSWFYQGVFRLGQSKGRRPLSTLTLTGSLACGRGATTAQARKKKRRLWGDGKGKFRTKGKHSAATVVGTRWLVEDRCNGTLTRVTKGRVRVRDFRARRTVVVRAGKRYFARAR
jgi:CSLREA domain-containing protein